MARYPKQGDKGGKNVIPSVTEIISDCSKGPPLQWSANMAVEWIRENCTTIVDMVGTSWGVENLSDLYVTESELNEARFAYKKVSEKALDIGSEVHALIERFLKGEDVDD